MFYTINRTYRNALYKKAPTINFNISGYKIYRGCRHIRLEAGVSVIGDTLCLALGTSNRLRRKQFYLGTDQ